MTLTETKPEDAIIADAGAAPGLADQTAPGPDAALAPTATAQTQTQAPASRPQVSVSRTQALADLLSTGDSTLIGRLWVFFGLGFGVFSAVAGLLVAAERLNTGRLDLFAGHRAHFLFFSLHGVSLVLLCVVPLFIGLAHCVVPRQIGASSMAFPRLAMASLAIWLIGSGLLIASWGIDGGLAAGGSQEATELSLLSLGLVVLALAVASLNLACTVILQRSQNFPRLADVPFFSLAILVVGGLWLVSFAILLGNVMVMWVDARGVSAAKYGLGENLYGQISWIFTQQQVFAFALPLLGIVADALQGSFGQRKPGSAMWPPAISATRSKAQSHAKLVVSLFAIVAFGGAIQGFFNPEFFSSPVYVVAPFVAILILLGVLRALGMLVREQSAPPRPTLGLLLGGMSLALLLGAVVLAGMRTVGRLVGVLDIFSDEPDWRNDLDRLLSPFDNLLGTTAGTSVFHATLLAGLLGAIAGLYIWGPGVLGHKLRASVGLPAGLMIFVGTLLYAVPDMVSGFWGQPELPAASIPQAQAQTFVANSGVEVANIISFIGACAVLLGLALVALDVLAALRQGTQQKLAAADSAGASSSQPAAVPDMAGLA